MAGLYDWDLEAVVSLLLFSSHGWEIIVLVFQCFN